MKIIYTAEEAERRRAEDEEVVDVFGNTRKQVQCLLTSDRRQPDFRGAVGLASEENAIVLDANVCPLLSLISSKYYVRDRRKIPSPHAFVSLEHPFSLIAPRTRFMLNELK